MNTRYLVVIKQSMKSVEDLLATKVLKTDGCWLWTGSKDKDGYGIVSLNPGSMRMHREAWAHANGRAVPDGLLVLHKCDNPPCVNPDHLFLGTHADNAADRKAKGRSARLVGDANPSRRHPERLARGDESTPRKHRDRLPRGDKHWTRRDPDHVSRGESVPTSRLTEAQVREIRSRFVPRVVTYKRLADEYGVQWTTVRAIVLRIRWRHVE